MVGRTDAERSHNIAAQRAWRGRYAPFLSLRQRGRRTGCQRSTGSATVAADAARGFGRRCAGGAAGSPIARIRLPLPADDYAAGVQD